MDTPRLFAIANPSAYGTTDFIRLKLVHVISKSMLTEAMSTTDVSKLSKSYSFKKRKMKAKKSSPHLLLSVFPGKNSTDF